MRRLVLGLVLAVACRTPAPPPAAPAPTAAPYRAPDEALSFDPSLVATGAHYLVVSEAPLATAVGRDVLAHGGDAADAAVATAFALAVVHPSAGNLAGGGFAVVRTGPGQALALDFRETAPAAATPTMFLDAHGKPTKASLIGDLASGVPGSVAGLWALHEKLGKLPWKDLVAPAIAYARNGFIVDQALHDSIARRAARPGITPAMAAQWLPGGKPLPVGARVTDPALADALERIAQQGPAGFYTGPTAQAIVAEMQRGGGLITAADLAGYKAVWRDPLWFTYRGYHVATMPLPSSGGIVLAMTANMLRGIDLGKLGWHSVAHVHWLVEAWRRAYAARNTELGDPAYVQGMPLDKLLSQAYADRLVATIGPRATPSRQVPPLLEGDHTTNLCVVDGTGQAVALTTTLNTAFGNGVLVDGFLLNNEMDDFTAKPGSPNTFGLVQGEANKIEPGKRMLSSMTPTIAEDDKGQLAMVVGAEGGPRIITEVWQTLSNVIDFRMTVGEAIAAPRLHHQHLPDEVDMEPRAITRQVFDQLRALGYPLVWQPPLHFGTTNAIVRTRDGWRGAADPRLGGAAMGG